MHEKLEKIKAHVVKHQEAYLIGGVAGITYVIMRGRTGLALRGPDPLLAYGGVDIRPLAFLSKQTNYIFVTIKQELGRPPYLVHDLTSDLWYSSQYKVAKALGASESMVSRHITGKLPHVKGHLLERILVEA